MGSTSVVSSVCMSSHFVVSHWKVSLASFYPSLVFSGDLGKKSSLLDVSLERSFG